MQQSALAAAWFFPFVLPICLYVAFTDLREMRITNQAVIVLALVFVAMGPLLFPFQDYLWALAQLVIVLVFGIVLNAAGAMGAGDAKFLAAAAPYIALGDLRLILPLFAAVLLASYGAHRVAKFTALRNLAPDWESWEQGRKFPMGFALGPSLALYLGLAAFL
ncbi:MAG: prepilin peptidase, partial [Pseudomonadota bacterium]